MGKLKLLFFLWGMFYSLLGITASEISLKNWIGEDSSGKFKMTKVDDCLDIVSPDGLTLWYGECLLQFLNLHFVFGIQLLINFFI